MALFGIPWKAFTLAVPVLADIVCRVKGGDDMEKGHKDINELKAKALKLEAEMDSLYKALRVIIVVLPVLAVISISALVIAIVAVSK